MADERNPWARQNGASAANRNRRVLIWIAFILALTLGLWQLSRLFPGAISKEDEPRLVYVLGWLALLSSGFVFARQIKLGEAARNIVIWAAVAAVLVIGYIFRDELDSMGTRVRSEFVPGDAVVSGDHALTLTQDDSGDFYIYGEANGTRVRFLVDTGASGIVLSPSDAQRIGIDMAALHFAGGYETANGIGSGALYTLDTMSVGPLQFSNVPVSINRTDMHASLLGMSFLKRLRSFEIRGRQMYLRW